MSRPVMPKLTIEVRTGYVSQDSPGELAGRVTIGYDTSKWGWTVLHMIAEEGVAFRMSQSPNRLTRWRGRWRGRRLARRLVRDSDA